MTTAEFITIGEDVLSEYLPKTRAADRQEALKAFAEELRAQGLDIEEEEVEEEEDDDS